MFAARGPQALAQQCACGPRRGLMRDLCGQTEPGHGDLPDKGTDGARRRTIP
ncbi:hypothetical protein GCM10025734_62270 [Kitasatospora paranensis]